MGDSFDLGRVGAAAKPAALTLPAEAVSASPTPTSTSANLVTPRPPAALTDDQVAAAIKLERDVITRMEVMSAEFIVAIMTLDLRDPRFFQRAADVRTLGNDALQASAESCARLLDRPVGSLAKGGSAAAPSLTESLQAVRREATELSLARQGDMVNARKLFGVIKTGDPVRSYFGRLVSSQADINAVLLGLQVSQMDLRQDNTNLDRDRQQTLVNLDKLRQYLYLAQRLETSLVDRVIKTEKNDPERARFLRDDLLSNARQKVQDLTTNLGLSLTGYLAIDSMERNNLELIRALEQAKIAILSALRTAAAVSQTATDQKLVLDQISMLKDPTLGAVATPPTGRKAAAAPQPPATGPDLHLLQIAFDNLFATLDEIDAWRTKSSATMVKTGAALQAYLDRHKPASLRGRAAR